MLGVVKCSILFVVYDVLCCVILGVMQCSVHVVYDVLCCCVVLYIMISNVLCDVRFCIL